MGEDSGAGLTLGDCCTGEGTDGEGTGGEGNGVGFTWGDGLGVSGGSNMLLHQNKLCWQALLLSKLRRLPVE